MEQIYEIHLTIDLKENNNYDKFINACKELSVKPIILDLVTQRDIIKDAMTSSIFKGTFTGLNKEIERIKRGLSKNGFIVIRDKIEIPPSSKCIPSDYQYFESHINIHTSLSDEDKLRNLSCKMGFHVSKNMRKITNNGMVIMATYRSKQVYTDFIRSLDNIRESIINEGFLLSKDIIEFVLYDSKVSHDDLWINL